jgi:transcriptional antiterminator NusG
MNFFVLRVASNKEDRVREALARKAKIEGVDLDGESLIGRILVPTERVRSMKGGVRKEADRKLYPG